MCIGCKKYYVEPEKPCKRWPKVKEARDKGCMHGYGIAPACPWCIKERLLKRRKKR